MRIGYRSLIAAAGVLAVVLTGCSPANSGSGSGFQGTKGGIKVGTLCFESGDTVAPESCTVVDAMAKAANASGGVNGYGITAVGCDVNRADPTALPNCIRKLVYSDKVDLFVGNFQSSGLYRVTEPLKIASLATTFGSAEDFTSPMAFPIWGHSATSLPVSVATLSAKGLRKPGAIVPNNVAGQSSVNALRDYYAKQGISIDVIPATPSEPDFTPFVSQARANADDPLVALESAAQIATISHAAQNLGYRPTIVAPYTAYDENLIKQGGTALNGVVVGSGYKPWTDTPEGDQLRQVMSKYGPSSYDLNFAAVQSYVGMKVLEQLLGTLSKKDPTPADISSALSTGTFTNDFLPGPISWSHLQNNPSGLARVASMAVVVSQVENGKLNMLSTRDFG
jgi:ABC-type branched-subunit amino acid transport system substrate-binding protein